MAENKKKLTKTQKTDLLLGLTGGFRIAPWHAIAAVSVASVAGLIMTLRWSFGSLEVQDLSDNFIDLLGGYLVLLVVLERAVGGLVELYYHRSLVDWELRLDRVRGALSEASTNSGRIKLVCRREEARIAELQGANFALGVPDAPDTDEPSTAGEWLDRLNAIKDSYEFLHARVLSRITTIVSYVVGGAGFFLAMFGMRLLDHILVLDMAKLKPLQLSVLTLMDVALTGAFLGGGSATISAIIAHFSKNRVSSSN